jgi:acyl-CoA synthetase (AMP-forming)/AMP-acid ligase II
MWVFPEIYQLGDIPRYHARNRPDAAAILADGGRMTWREVDLESNRVSNALRAAGARAGDCVGYLGKNTPFLPVALFGVSKGGMTFMPLNWRLAAAEIAVILSDSECKLIFVDSEFLGLAKDALQRAGVAPTIVELGGGEAAEFTITAFLRGASTEDPLIPVPSTTTALRVYTSGTTGLPKGVELSHENFNMTRLCEHLEPAIPWNSDDVFLMFMPNFHTAGSGLMLQSLYNGGAVSMLHAFEPGLVLRAIRETHPTILLIVPSALQMLLDHPLARQTDFSCLKLCMYAGSPISLPLIQRAMAEMRCDFVQWYGATETVSAVTLLRSHQHRLDDESKLRSCGTPLPLTSVRVVDASGADVRRGEVGEIWVRTPTLFKGYWRRPEETSRVKQNGWYRTGDAGYQDADGYLYIHDRMKDMIVSGGENVYSAEVERVLEKHPAVAQVAVIGVPDPKWGEAVKAIIVLHNGAAAEEAELISFCRLSLGGYKLPKSIDVVHDLPRTPSGKVQKAILRAAYWKGESRAIA